MYFVFNINLIDLILNLFKITMTTIANNFEEFIEEIIEFRDVCKPDPILNKTHFDIFNNILSTAISDFIKIMEYQGKPEEIEKIYSWLEDENI